MRTSPDKLARFQQAAALKERYLDSVSESEAWEISQEIIKKDAIQPEEFIGVLGYSEKQIRKDSLAAKEKYAGYEENETEQERKNRELADVEVVILYQQGGDAEWFGSASPVIVSRIEDSRKKADIIVEYPSQDDGAATKPKCSAFAVDATFSGDINDKVEKIKEEIRNGELTHIEYFRSQLTDFKGKLERVPRVIIGMSARTIRELMEPWLVLNKEIKTEEDRQKWGEASDKLAEHWVQFQILEEELIQLRAFASYAEYVNQPEVKRAYEEAYELVQEIYGQKQREFEASGKKKYDSMYRDEVFDKINDRMERLRNRHS